MNAPITDAGVGAGMLGSEKMACREKTWDELDDAQRIALLRRELRSVINRNDDLLDRVYALERHEHGGFGQLTVPLAADLNRPQGYRRRNPLE